MSIEALKEQARGHEQNEEWGQALDLYVQAIHRQGADDQPDLGLYNRAGDLNTRLGNVEGAIEYYERAVELYLDSELPNNAIAILKKILRNVPDRDEVLLRIGQIRAQQGFLTDARESFLAYAEVRQSDGDLEEAFRALTEFADLAPDDLQVQYALAQQLVAHERGGEAVDQLLRAHQRQASLGRMDTAAEIERKLREIDPGLEIPSVDALSGFESTALSLGDDDPEGVEIGFSDIEHDSAGRLRSADLDLEEAAEEELEFEPHADLNLDEISDHPAEDDIVFEHRPTGALEGEEPDQDWLAPSVADDHDQGDTALTASDFGVADGWEESEPLAEGEAPDLEVELGELVVGSPVTDPDFEAPPLGEDPLPLESNPAIPDPDFAGSEAEFVDADAGHDDDEDETELAAEPISEGSVPDDAWLTTYEDDDAVQALDAEAHEPVPSLGESGASDEARAFEVDGTDTPLPFLAMDDDEDDAPDLREVAIEAAWEESATERAVEKELVDELRLDGQHHEPGAPDDTWATESEAGLESEPASLDLESESAPEEEGVAGEALDSPEGSEPDRLDDGSGLEVEAEGGGPTAVEGAQGELRESQSALGEQHPDRTGESIEAIWTVDSTDGWEPEANVEDEPFTEPPAWNPGADLDGEDDAEETARSSEDVLESRAVAVAELTAPELREHLASHAEDPAAWHALAARLREEGADQDATEAMERAHRAYGDRGEIEQAITVVRELIAFCPDSVGAREHMVEYAHRNDDGALLVESYVELGDCLGRQGEPERAQAVFERVIELDPGNRRALQGLGRSTSEAGEPSSAYVDLASMIMEPREKTTRWTVETEEPATEEDFDFQEMLSQFKAKVAENVDVGDVRAHYDLGTAYREMGLIDEAISEFQNALRADGKNLATVEMLGQCFMDKGQPDFAIRSLTRAIEMPWDVEDELLGIYYYLGRAHEELGQRDEAVEFYEKVFALDINFQDVTDRLRSLR